MKITLLLLAVACSCVALVPMVSAQSLQEGTWTGIVTSPNGTALDVTYEVTDGEDGLAVTMHAEIGSFPFSDVSVEESTLTFSWDPGTFLQCELYEQEDGSYKGECVDASGQPGQLVMMPPADEE